MATPPQMFIDAGQPAGFEIDLARAIAGTMCLKPQFVNIAFGGLFPGLVAKKFDYITSGLGITPQRQQVFDFVPYLAGGIQLVVRKDSGLHFKDENGFAATASPPSPAPPRRAPSSGSTRSSASRARRSISNIFPASTTR